MTLQEDFFKYVKSAITYYYPDWTRRPTEQWYSCYARMGAKERVILYVKKPGKNGAFWIWVSISSEKIDTIPDLIVKKDIKNRKKTYLALKNTRMKEIELLDREANGGWERNWPAGFKIEDITQFELGKQIIMAQWA